MDERVEELSLPLGLQRLRGGGLLETLALGLRVGLLGAGAFFLPSPFRLAGDFRLVTLTDCLPLGCALGLVGGFRWGPGGLGDAILRLRSCILVGLDGSWTQYSSTVQGLRYSEHVEFTFYSKAMWV